MNSRTTTLVEPAVEITPYFPHGEWDPPVPGPMYCVHARPLIEGEFEAYTGPNPTTGHQWTRFQHYQRWMPAFMAGTINLPYAAAWPNTGSRYWLGAFPPWIGWVQHEGLARVMKNVPALYTPSTVSWGFLAPPAELDSLLQRALKGTMPVVKTEMSLINSVIELKDFKGLVKGFTKGVKRLHELEGHLPSRLALRNTLAAVSAAWKRYINSFKKRSGMSNSRYVMRVASENFLQWKFAVAPLISDVLALQRALKSLEKQINDLVTNEGRVRVKHWGATYTKLPSAPLRKVAFGMLPPYIMPAPSVESWINTQSSDASSQFHVEVKYNYNFTSYQREHARILGLLDGLGVNLNPSIIWNAIPWTFVIDWVVNIGSFLDQFKVRNMEPKINIVGCLWSERVERQTHWSKSFESNIDAFYTRNQSMPSVKEVAYQRTPFIPGISSLVASGLNSSEVTLGAALIGARRRKVRHK